MRRKSTRAAAKASPEKPKEEKIPKKTRRHSKRHKPTSSESESEDEVSVSSNETPTQVGGELWTVTQTEPSTNDIGKIKICLARPSPATPERTERASKRLRNKPIVNMEDSPPAPEEKPVRRTRRSRGGSSPLKKEELPPPTQQQQQPPQQQQEEVCEEKKGKGKSKGKHKSKIVEQAAHIDVEPTEMQSEISENVQVTAQSPQNVDNSDAECVERDLSQFADENDKFAVCKSGDGEEQDTNDNIVDASHNDISNNNVANDINEQSNDGDVTNADAEQNNSQSEEVCNKSVALSEKSILREDEDVSMKEVTHFEINVSANDSKIEEPETPETKDTIKDEKHVDTKAEVQESLKTETDLVEKEIKPATVPEVKDESPLQTLPEEIKHEETKVEIVESKEEVKEETKAETMNREVKPQELKCENPPIVIENKCKMEVIKKQVQDNDNDAESVVEAVDQKQELQDEPKVESKVTEESATKETTDKSPKPVEVEEAEKMQKEKLPEPEVDAEVKKSPKRIRRHEQPEEKASVERVTTPPPPPINETVADVSKVTETTEDTTEDATEDTKASADAAFATPAPKSVIPIPWGECSSAPNILLTTSMKLLEMYPTLTLLDESSVKLESTPRERPQKVKEARRVSNKVEKVLPSLPPKVKRQDSTASMASTTETEASSIALHRKISIVEDEASSLRPPPSPAQHAKSPVLFITNLVRPFTVKQLRGLLERTGMIVEGGFWTDKIKSKCYVQYETEEEAEATRNAIHGVLWPIGNGKKLIIDFATMEDLEKAKSPPVVVPAPVVVKPEPEKENHEPPKTIEENNTSEVKTHGWDEKEHARRGRSPSVDIKRRYSQSRQSRSPSEEIKKRRDEPMQQRAMDDLFRKTEATPSIYWQPLQPEEIALKQQQRLERMEAHKRKMESQQTRQRRNSDRRGGPYRRRY